MSKFSKFGFMLMFLVFNQSIHACAKIDNVESPGFCQQFEEIARCHCSQSLSSRFCQNVQQIYSRMLATFGSIDKACRFQHDTSQQNCMDAWQCYLKGGQLQNGQICSGTGRSCV